MTDSAMLARQKIAEAASAMLAGSISYIEGAQRISQLSHDALLSNDPDIVRFVAIDSETDALPIAPEIKKLWSPSALEKLQPEIVRLEAWSRSFGEAACGRLVKRFGQAHSN